MTRAVQSLAGVIRVGHGRQSAQRAARPDFRGHESGPSPRPGKITFIDDRRRAISLALDSARPGDCLLIAGKGHESYQEFADTIIPFDDRQVVRELIGVKQIKERMSRHGNRDMTVFTPGQLAAWSRGAGPAFRLSPSPAHQRHRALRPGQLFVALKIRPARRA